MEHIFLHGLGRTPESWNRVLEKLGIKNADCPNLPAFAAGKPVTYAGLYRALTDEFDAAEGKINLCGLSLGGVLALNYTLEHPDKVRSLVLIAAQYRMPKRTLRLQNSLFRLMPKGMFAQTGFSKEDMISLCASMTELDFSSALSGISCPTLVICGEKDAANRRASEELAEHIPSARLGTVPGSGHEVNLDAAEQLAELLQAFYKVLIGLTQQAGKI